MMKTVAACEAGCAMRGRHSPYCSDRDACWGCLPRLAADGLRLCIPHAEGIVSDALEAPILYSALGDRLNGGGTAGERTSGSGTGAPTPSEDVMEARAAIRSALLRLARLITTERGVSGPTKRHAGRVYASTDPESLARLVARHAEWLAAHPNAAEHSALLRDVVRGTVRGLAYPSGSERLYVGECPLLFEGESEPCGARLYQVPDSPLIECPGCGTAETIERWQRWIVGDAPSGETDAYALAAYLTLHWMRPVDPATIRQWASRGHISPVTVADPAPGDPDRESVKRDGRNRTQYKLAKVVEYARTLWGPPARPMERV